MSKPREDGKNSKEAKNRVVALWKDAFGRTREIELPEGAEALVLTLNRQYRQEWSADGRQDFGATAYLTFGGVHPIRRPPAAT